MKAYTNLEQSKKLAEILPLESADMHYPDYYFDGNAKGPCNTPYKEAIEDLFHVYINPKTKRLLPCWSLTPLLGVLPILDNRSPVLSKTFDGKYRVVYHSTAHEMAIIAGDYDNPVDACVAMIEKLHVLKLL